MGSWKNISDLEKINFVAHENRYDNLVVAANYIKNEEILPKIISQELRLAHVDLSILTAEKEELEGLHIIKKVLEISKSAEEIVWVSNP